MAKTRHMSLRLPPAEAIENYLAKQQNIQTLRFITCGSVDDGKSTLIGRMLYDSQLLLDDQIQSLKKESKRETLQEDNINFSLLVDGLSAEREQGITIDVAYRFFNTDRRKFIVADTPGHEQYTRNMVTGASTADLAVILVDARAGILTQTRRHSFLCSLLGIHHVIVAINKMDLVSYEEETFNVIKENYLLFSENLGFHSTAFVPISALKGENIVTLSPNMSWYNGRPLLRFLEDINVSTDAGNMDLRLPVQWVNRPHLDFRGFSGTLAEGVIHDGMSIRILPSLEKAFIKDIFIGETQVESATSPQSVTVTLDREVDVSRGDILVHERSVCEISDQFAVKLIWMDQDSGFVGRLYRMKIATNTVNAQISEIKNNIDVNTLKEIPKKQLEMNDICTAKIIVDRSIPFERYKDSRPLGSFILIDRLTNRTVGAGIIEHSLRRSQNIYTQNMEIDVKARCRLNGHKNKVLWFTGISGSGKSTIANALEKELYKQGIHTYVLDGDNIRQGLNKDLGFSERDRVENIRRVAEVARVMADAGLVVLASFISPFRAERQMARGLFNAGEFIEIFLSVDFSVAEKRDPKGLYKKARRGDLPNFTGIDSPYEAPLNPEIVLDTNSDDVETTVSILLKKINLILEDGCDD